MRYEKPVYYNHKSEHSFQQALKRNLDQYFSSKGGNRKATYYMWFKVTVFLTSYVYLWSQLALTSHDLLATALLLLAFVWITMFVAFNVSHDAVHLALTGNPKIDNFIFYISFNLLGPNAYLWRIRHSNAHHFFVNIPGSDMDIEGTHLLRVAPHVKWRPMHRFQHIYCAVFYSIFTMHWIFFKDFKIMRMKTFGNVTDFNHSFWRYIELVVWKLFYVFYMIIVPSIFLPYSLAQILSVFIVFHLTMSFLLLVIFAMSHVAMESHYVIPNKQGRIPHSFLEHQLLTSVDYNSQNPFMGFLFGGFNNHVAHHMFPQICSVHYIAITKMISETAALFGLPYHEMNMWSLVKSHFRIMKTLGQAPQQGDQFVVSMEEIPLENDALSMDSVFKHSEDALHP